MNNIGEQHPLETIYTYVCVLLDMIVIDGL